MKGIFVLFSSFMLFSITINSQITVTVTGAGNTTPALSNSYPTLLSALDAFDDVTAMTGPVVFAVTGSETAPVTGFSIGNATVNSVLNSTNTFTIIGNATINAGIGTQTPMSPSMDGMLVINGSDWVTIDGLTFTDSNLTNPATMEFGIGLFKLSADDGCQNNTIQNCTVNVKTVNAEAATSPMVDGAVGILMLNSTSTAATTALTPTLASGSNSSNKFYANSVNGGNYGIAIIGFAALTPFNLGDTSNDIGGLTSNTGNTVLNYGSGGAVASSGIRVNNQWNVNISNNTINNNNGLVPGHTNHANTLRGIYAQSGTSADASINNNIVTVHGGGTTSQVAAIECGIGTTPNGNVVNITGNTVQGDYLTATSGVFYGIYSNTVTASSLNITTNTVTNLIYSDNGLTGSGVMYPIFASGSNAGSTFTVSQNFINNIQRFGSTGGTTIGIYISAGVAGMTTDLQENTITNMSIDGTGTASTMYGIQVLGANNTINSNTVSNLNIIKTTATSIFYGIFHSGTSGQVTIGGNQVSNLINAGTGTTYGIYGGTSTVPNRDFTGNTINNLSCNCVTLVGMNTYGNILNVTNNKIFDLTTNTTGSPSVTGITLITLATSGTGKINNNLISNLFAPFASTTTPTTSPSIRGIGVTTTATTSNIEVAYNTVLINATSTGVNFGTTAMFSTGSATATSAKTVLYNNIFVNKSTPNGTGKTVAYHRSSTNIANYDDLSNNNLFYSGSPGLSNVIYYDGTNFDQMLPDFKTRVTPRETNSVTEDPPFLSLVGADPNFLHIDPVSPTLVESNGIPVAGISSDFDGNVRNATTPDIGADELNGTIAANMSYVSSTTTQTNTSNVLSNLANQVVIGVEIVMSGSLNPINLTQLDFNTNGTTSVADIANAKVWYTGTTPLFSAINQFGSNVSNPSGVFSVNGSQVLSNGTNYFWLTYDVLCTAVTTNVIDAECSSVVVSSAQVPSVQAPTGNRIIEFGPISGIKTVGTGGDYPTLLAAINKVNLTGLNGDLTLEVLNDLVETSSVVINQWNDCGGVFNLTIKPDAGVDAIISGAISANALIKLNGADRVTIDGSNNNSTSRNLTINNTAANASSSNIWLGSLTGNGCENNLIKNCKLNGASTNHSCIVMSSGTTVGGVAEAANNNNSFVNNEITTTLYGIALIGIGGNDQNNIISDNKIGSLTTANKIRRHSIALFQQSNCEVNNNTIFGVTSTATTATTYPAGIYFGGTANGISVYNNTISDVKNTSTTGYNASGININSTSPSSGIDIYNNAIYDISAHGNVANTRNGYGIFMQGGGGVDIVNNSIDLNTNPTLTTGLPACINIAPTVIALNSINIVNNILSNSQTIGTERYSIYSGAGDTVFALVDYNDYATTGPNLGFIGSNRTTLADIQTGFGDNLNSVNIAPNFIPSSILKIFGPNTLSNLGTPIPGLTTDIDGDIRNATTPDIGADEWSFSNNLADFCNIENPGDTVYIIGEPQINIYGQIFEAGLTEGAGNNNNIFAWFGINTENTDPSTWPQNSWSFASYDSQQGNDDQYVKAIGNSLSIDTFYYAFRYLALPGQYTYGGYSSSGGGIWDGVNNKNGRVIVKLCNDFPLLTTEVEANCISSAPSSFDINVTVDPGITVNWFNNPTGGTTLYEGTNFTTPSINQNTTYYAETSSFGFTYLGPLDPSIGTSTGSTIAIGTQRMFFNVLSPVTLDSVDIFPTATIGSVGSVVIRNSSQVPLDTFSYTTTVTSGQKQTIPIGFLLNPGTGYEIGQGTAISLLRNSTGAVYPYSSNEIVLTGNSFDPVYYYFYYNWRTSINCTSSERIPVEAAFTGDTVMNENNGGSESLRAVLGCISSGDTVLFDIAVDTIFLSDSLLINTNATLLDNQGSPVVLKYDFNLPNLSTADFGLKVANGNIVNIENIIICQSDNSVSRPVIQNEGTLNIKNSEIKGNNDSVLKSSNNGIIYMDGAVNVNQE